MKVAICMSGLVRTFKSCYQSYLDNIINLYDCDLFAFVSNDANIADMDLIKWNEKVVIDPDPVLDEKDYFQIKDRRTKFYSIQGWLQQLWKIQKCHDLMLNYQINHNIRYDLVIRCRPDLLITRKIDDLTTLDTRFIYTPIWPPNFDKIVPKCYEDDYVYDYIGNCSNLPDQIAIGNVPLMSIYAQRYENLYNIVHSGPSWSLCAERSLTKHLQYYNVPVKFLKLMTEIKRP